METKKCPVCKRKVEGRINKIFCSKLCASRDWKNKHPNKTYNSPPKKIPTPKRLKDILTPYQNISNDQIVLIIKKKHLKKLGMNIKDFLNLEIKK